VAIGYAAGQSAQGQGTVAIGSTAGQSNQGSSATAIGDASGLDNQGVTAVAVGNRAGRNSQGVAAVAVGDFAGNSLQGISAVAIGDEAGRYSQVSYAVAVGNGAATFNQSTASVAMGNLAGYSNQGAGSVSIGNIAGYSAQGSVAVAIGQAAGAFGQNAYSVSIGWSAGRSGQALNSVAIGEQAGESGQRTFAVAIGANAGQTSQGAGSICIGTYAGSSGFANTVVINAAGAPLASDRASACFIKPIRGLAQATAQTVLYNNTTGELTFGSPTSDVRLKSNIVVADLNICYDVIKSLELKRFRFDESVYTNEQCPDRNKLGWIAQEVEQVLPKSLFTVEHELANGYVLNDCRLLEPSQIYASMFGAIKKLITITEQKYTGTGTIETDSFSNVISVTGVSWESPIIQVTPIFNGEVRNLNVSRFDLESNSFTVYGGSGDFFWSVTS
jgi:hypothetical protein